MLKFAIIAVLLLCSAAFQAYALPAPPQPKSFMEEAGEFFSSIFSMLGINVAPKDSLCTLETEAAPAGAGMVSGAGKYPCGSVASLKSSHVSGWEISGWTVREGDCAIFGNAGEIAVVKLPGAQIGRAHV